MILLCRTRNKTVQEKFAEKAQLPVIFLTNFVVCLASLVLNQKASTASAKDGAACHRLLFLVNLINIVFCPPVGSEGGVRRYGTSDDKVFSEGGGFEELATSSGCPRPSANGSLRFARKWDIFI